MLEKPDIRDEQIAVCLRNEYALNITEITFLPLGADANAGVYQAADGEGQFYFVKLRRGTFDAISVYIPKFLHEQGIREIIPPLPTLSGSLWTQLEAFNVVLYSFVEGQNGWAVALSEAQWHIFGRALRQIHSVMLPADLKARIPRENYSPYWREEVKQFQKQIEHTHFADPDAAGLAQLLKDKQLTIDHLIKRAEDLSAILQQQETDEVLCHTDIHMGNLLIQGDGRLYIVDWDQPILAPKERDLMFINSGIGNAWLEPEQEAALFYAGYGQTEINPVALAYYRYERIVQDFAAYAEQLLLTDEGGADRAEGLRRVASQFLPGAVIEMACRTEKILPVSLQSHLN